MDKTSYIVGGVKGALRSSVQEMNLRKKLAVYRRAFKHCMPPNQDYHYPKE